MGFYYVFLELFAEKKQAFQIISVGGGRNFLLLDYFYYIFEDHSEFSQDLFDWR